MDRLKECLNKLEPLKGKSIDEFREDPYLQDVVERNLEVAAQSCIDIANRIISLEDLQKPSDYYRAIEILGEAGILPAEFAQDLAPIAGFRNVLVHQYLEVDQEELFGKLHNLEQLYQFSEYIKKYLEEKES